MKERLDVLLFERGLCATRSRAKTLIMEGAVFVDGNREDKAGSLFSTDCQITVKEDTLPFVSRGGLKIQKAIKDFSIDLEGLVTMDVGASTGGFTDCMLQNGASMVYSVDVGYGQLDYRLRTDSRVVVMERTNIRKVPAGSLDPAPAFSSIDVSFISLKTVLPHVKDLLTAENSIVALIKPQFEAGKDQVGKNGVVRDPAVHERVIEEILGYTETLGYHILGLTFSPVKGPKGNIEYLLYISNRGEYNPENRHFNFDRDSIHSLVKESHETLGV